MKKLILFFVFLISLFLLPPSVQAAESTCLIYFTGIGCPHCAKVDPLLEQLSKEHSDLVIIEYEIYQKKENASLIYEYNEAYGSGLKIPLIIFGKDNFLVGDTKILGNVREAIEDGSNPCPLIDGTSVNYEELDVSQLPGNPKILPETEPQGSGEIMPTELTLPKVISLATVDAINPCALAVLTMMLFAILAFSPKKRRNVLLAGLAFTSAVFVMYFFYGLVIIRFFQLIQALTSIKLWLYKILGLVAITLGLLNLKDFVRYKPGGFLTEMPMFLRPKVQNLMFKATSPKGAFVVGALVTLFLLPCTIGPYIICGGILCTLDLIEIIPWLLLYNLIFVLPMLAITAACYIGFTTVENVAGWKDKNIRYLHLVAGIIILLLGMVMILGWA
jgi:cytochrome c biogenesis protein CcdA